MNRKKFSRTHRRSPGFTQGLSTGFVVRSTVVLRSGIPKKEQDQTLSIIQSRYKKPIKVKGVRISTGKGANTQTVFETRVMVGKKRVGVLDRKEFINTRKFVRSEKSARKFLDEQAGAFAKRKKKAGVIAEIDISQQKVAFEQKKRKGKNVRPFKFSKGLVLGEGEFLKSAHAKVVDAERFAGLSKKEQGRVIANIAVELDNDQYKIETTYKALTVKKKKRKQGKKKSGHSKKGKVVKRERSRKRVQVRHVRHRK